MKMAANASSIPRLAIGRLHPRWYVKQVLPQEACVGSIIWISQRFDGDDDITCVRPSCDDCDGKKLMEAGYMHPAVILKIRQYPGSIIPGDLILEVSDVGCCHFLSHCPLLLFLTETEAGGKGYSLRDGYEETRS
jgi:hypothetical protein